MESPFKTPSKPASMSQTLLSSSSSSPFTPKRSLIRKKNDELTNSVPTVSRVLAFDDSVSRSPFRKLEFSSLSQQTLSLLENKLDESEPTAPVKTLQKYDGTNNTITLSQSIGHFSERRVTTEQITPLGQHPLCENTIMKSEYTTPVKTPKNNCETSNKVLLSPSIKNRPKRFNITEQNISISSPSPKKRCGSNNSTPSKRLKTNVMNNSKPITHYFKPIQKRPDSLSNKFDRRSQLAEDISNEENMNFQTENCIKSEHFIQSISGNIDSSKLEEPNKIKWKNNNKSLSTKNKKNKSPKKDIVQNINSIQSQKKARLILSHQTEKNSSPKKKTVKSPITPIKEIKQPDLASQITPSKNESTNTTPLRSPRIIEYLENKVVISGGDTYSRFVKYIVLKGDLFCLGHEKIITIVENCTDDELKIYGRLISRKHGWIRYDEPDGLKKYKEKHLCADFDSVLKSLATKHLVNTDVISCELDCLLNILKSQELRELQKTFNINLSSNKNTNKAEMIKSFINLVKKQRTFCGNSTDNLKERVKKKLGCCLKVSDTLRNEFFSCLIYETYPYFRGDEKDRLRECFNTFSLFEKKQLKFPNFKTKRVSLNFSSKDSLEKYKIALDLRYKVQLSLEQKDIENAITVLKNMYDNLQSFISDKNLIEETYMKIPTYMRKYSEISVYAHTLFKNITILKKSTDKDLAKEVLEFLLKHKEFSKSKQANLHIELAKVFETQYKQIDLAAKVILDGLKDETMNELDRQMLSKRAMMYVNRKVRKLDNELKKEILSFTTITEIPIPTTTVNGKIIPSSEKGVSGRKQVYSKKNGNGDIFCMSVEELAILHYKNRGFSNAIHDEGQIIKSMFLLCFWDIIYGSYPPHHLFINKFQDCPLDWRTRHFYNIREQNIKDRMEELKQMSVDEICDVLKIYCDKHFETQSVINWKFMNVDNLSLCKTLLECVGIKVFLAIGEQILRDSRIYLHGMPDLIVWDAINHKCIFAEVKGPKDKLSERQHSWLLKLMEFGANVEVCHVIGTGGKNNDEEME